MKSWLMIINTFHINIMNVNVKIYLTHALDLRMFSVEVLLKFWQLIQVPPLLAESLTRIPKLYWWGSTATAHGPKPWPEK